MKLPTNVIIPREKLTKYLLIFRPESDKSQFLAQAGFTQSNPDMLEASLREMIATYEATLDRRNYYGDFYRVEGILRGANNCDLLVVTIWIIQANQDGYYRFVTLKPWRKNL